ncbi:adenylosuccinate synthase, partial [Candidatus Woesearchaeota archaeon]|nr:adenylosuccinate synthase [Candidatus Woesearchaeota archaeon]
MISCFLERKAKDTKKTDGDDNMKHDTIVMGGQWGDEGKGKIVDELSGQHDAVIRYNGLDNAGHTVVVDDEKYVLHGIPSGILRPGVMNVIAAGCFISLDGLVAEIRELRERGVDVSPQNLAISEKAHVVPAYNRVLDVAKDMREGVGTTARGAGPSAGQRAERTGIPAGWLVNTHVAEGELLDQLPVLEQMIKMYVNPSDMGSFQSVLDAKDLDELVTPTGMLRREPFMHDLKEAKDVLGPFIRNTEYLIHDMHDQGGSMLFEGAQGTLLDNTFGSYPFVTVSHPGLAGVPAGTGYTPDLQDSLRIGVFKAYITRVGRGPFPTRMEPDTEERIRQKGGEYGATTGRPRNCGWFDAFAMQYAIMTNHLTDIALTKLDILSGEPEVRICTGYHFFESKHDQFPSDGKMMSLCYPVYDCMDGWNEDISLLVKEGKELPAQAQKFLHRIQELAGDKVQLSTFSAGPGR